MPRVMLFHIWLIVKPVVHLVSRIALYARRYCAHVSTPQATRGERLLHHDAWVVIYHDHEKYHDCHVMQIFSINKQTI